MLLATYENGKVHPYRKEVKSTIIQMHEIAIEEMNEILKELESVKCE
jgi:hypothetical protein